MMRLMVGILLALGIVLPVAQGAASASVRPAASGSLLRDGTGLYPRAIRLAHSGAANGRVLASVVTFDGNNGQGAIYESTDDGATFAQVGTVADPHAAGGLGLCCSTLYELPTQVGALPAGTLIWAASVGQDANPRNMEIRAWSSTDTGRTWSLLATISTAGSTLGMWEPEFTVAADGRLVCVFSDETQQPTHSQTLVESVSSDGVSWSPRANVVALGDSGARPGMANVRALAGGGYLMTYEICGSSFGCAVFSRTSTDGVDWGDPGAAGTAIVSTAGLHFAHAPTIARAGDRLVLIGQVLQDSGGATAAGNGATIMVNDGSGTGDWVQQAAPVSVPDARDDYCPNYSSSLLPSADGMSLLEVASDYDGTVCKPYYATGPLA